jgi:hypothetical protein
MIELPESHALAEQIKKTLTGKRISDVIANQNPHGFAWYSGDPADYPTKLTGKTVTGAHVWSGPCVRRDRLLRSSWPTLAFVATGSCVHRDLARRWDRASASGMPDPLLRHPSVA